MNEMRLLLTFYFILSPKNNDASPPDLAIVLILYFDFANEACLFCA